MKKVLPSGNLTQLLNMAIEIVSFLIKNGHVPYLCKRLADGYSSSLNDIKWVLDGSGAE